MSRPPAGGLHTMTTMIDLGPAAERMSELIAAVPDDRLDASTPCTESSVADLLDHIGGLSLAFIGAAEKADLPADQRTPRADADNLGDDWRQRIPADVQRLAEAWRDPDAWTGMTQAGPIEMPGEVAGVVALDELVVHGWDLAKALGQPYDLDAVSLGACHDFLASFSGPGSEEERGTAFGPVVDVPDDAAMIDRVVGLSGRDPGWSPGVRDPGEGLESDAAAGDGGEQVVGRQ